MNLLPKNTLVRRDADSGNMIHDLQQARQELEKLHQQHPTNLKILLQLGNTSHKLRDHTASLKYYQKALNIYPDKTLQLTPFISQQYRMLMQYIEAEQLLTPLILSGLKSENLYREIAFVEFNKGNLKAASENLLALIDLDPSNAEATFSVSLMLRQFGLLENSNTMLTKLSNNANNFKKAGYLFEIGQNQLLQFDLAAAEMSFAAALHIQPDNMACLNARINLAFRRYDYELAVELTQAALNLRPNDCRILFKHRHAINACHIKTLPENYSPPLFTDQPTIPISEKLSFPRVLLLTSVLPGGEGAAGVYLRSLFDLYPAHRITWLSTTQPDAFGIPNYLDQYSVYFTALPELLKCSSRSSREARHAQLLSWRHYRNCAQRDILKDILGYIKKEQIKILWSDLTNPLLFSIVGQAASTAKIDLVLTILDPPEFFIEPLSIQPWMKRALYRDFERTVQLAKRCATISDEMSNIYLKKYQHEIIKIPHSLAVQNTSKAIAQLRHQDQLVIGYIGKRVYCDAEWKAFISACAAINWRIENRKISLVLFTKIKPTGITDSMPITWVGWLKQSELLKQLQSIDIGYTPYWFAADKSAIVQQSFPSKISCYAAASKPIFHHGPAHSTITQFMRRYPMGLSCHSLQPDAIVEKLSAFIEADQYAHAVQMAETAFTQEFSDKVIRHRFYKLLGVEDAASDLHH